MQSSQIAQEGTPAAFRTRVDDVFGQLQAPADSSGPSWSLSQKQVFRPGKEEAFSSDEEEEAVAQEQSRQELLPGSLVDFEGVLICLGGTMEGVTSARRCLLVSSRLAAYQVSSLALRRS